jgi:hypothetical protein
MPRHRVLLTAAADGERDERRLEGGAEGVDALCVRVRDGGARGGRSADARRFVGVSVQPAGCSDGIEGGTDDCNFDGDLTDTGVTVGAVPGFICGDPTARRIIASFGFKPIASGVTDAGSSSYGTSNCRRNKTGF